MFLLLKVDLHTVLCQSTLLVPLYYVLLAITLLYIQSLEPFNHFIVLLYERICAAFLFALI